MPPTDYDLLLFGHFAIDRNVVDGHGQFESGGGVYFGSVALRRLGLRVAVVTRLHPDDFPRLKELEAEGVRVYASPAPETSGIENTYTAADMERRICKPLGFAGAIQLEDLPEVTARVYLIAPIIAGEVDLALLTQLAGRGPVGLDVQGFVRVRVDGDLVFRPWAEMHEGLRRVTYLKVDRAEAELLTGQSDLLEAAPRLAALGPREVVITQSSGVTVYAEGHLYEAPFASRVLAGRTGRGDTCFSTYVGKRLSASPEESCRWAGALTTLKQEKPGPLRASAQEIAAAVARTPVRER